MDSAIDLIERRERQTGTMSALCPSVWISARRFAQVGVG